MRKHRDVDDLRGFQRHASAAELVSVRDPKSYSVEKSGAATASCTAASSSPKCSGATISAGADRAPSAPDDGLGGSGVNNRERKRFNLAIARHSSTWHECNDWDLRLALRSAGHFLLRSLR